MSVKQLHFNYQLAEAKGEIPEGTAGALTISTIMEAGLQAFHQAYFGNGIFAKVLSERAANHEANELTASLQEALLSDVRPVYRLIESIHTTADFPQLLAQIRNRVLRKTYSPIESGITGVATERDVNDFKPIRGYKFGNIDRLILRPEGTDVRYATIGLTDDLYVVANYERAIAYTWEAYVNDDLSVFTNALAELGNAARRTRIFVGFEALKQGLPQTVVGGAPGGPTYARLREGVKAIATLKNDDGNVIGFRANKLMIPTQWEEDANDVFLAEFIQTGNGTPTRNSLKGRLDVMVERLMARILGDDYLIYDDQSPFLEMAYLTGFRAGPKTYTKEVDTIEHLDEGCFKNHTFDIKVGDVVGAKVVDTRGVTRVKGS